jgi:hypothetical protein
MADKTESDTDTGAPLTLKELGKFIKDTVAEAVSGIKSTTDDVHEKAAEHTEEKLDRKSTIAEQVQAEIAKLRQQEKQEGESKAVTDRIAALEARVEEKPPVERRRVHRLMGWGE